MKSIINLYIVKPKILGHIIFLCTFLFLTSCSKGEESGLEGEEPEAETKEPEPEPESEISDKFIYTAMRNDGTLFEIGDERGEIKNAGRINAIAYNIVFNTVTSSQNKIFMYEHKPDIFYDNAPPVYGNREICVYDKVSKKTECHILDFSDILFPQESILSALDWDEENQDLIGVVSDELSDIEKINYLVRIDPITFEIKYAGIQFVQYVIGSSCLIGDKYYLSSVYKYPDPDTEFRALDLESGKLDAINITSLDSPPFLLSRNSDGQQLFGLAWKFSTGFTNAAVAMNYGIDDGINIISTSKRISFKQQFGKGFFNEANNEHLVLVDTEDGSGLLRYNSNTGSLRIIDLTPYENDLSSFVAIIMVKPNP